MTRPAASPSPWTPRGLRREEAARYVGISPSKFEQLVKDGRMPPPREIDGCRVWCRISLDAAFDDLPHVGQKPAGNPWDEASP
jgi:excisionase family DNA binding protein